MDLRSRYQCDDEVLQTLKDAVRESMYFAIPVKVVKDSDGHTAHLKPLIKAVRRKPDGSQELVELPEIPEAPVNFPSGGGTTTTHPIKADDVGYALVMSRGLDVWHQNDGEQPQVDARMHDLSDAIYCSGLRSTPKKLKDVSKDSVETRSDDGKHRMSLHPQDGVKFSVDNGKHTMAMNPKSGISMDTNMALAVKAAKGMSLDGALGVKGKVTSTESIGAPLLNGMVGGVAGFLLCFALTGWLMAHVVAGADPEGAQQARYVRTALTWPAVLWRVADARP